MVIRFVTYISAVVLFFLAALISATGGQGAGSCFAGMLGLMLIGTYAQRYTQRLAQEI